MSQGYAKRMKGVKKKYLTPSARYGTLPEVIEMERIGQQVFLYDFYGELLTEHQKRVYEDVVLNDLSLSEIAEELGISRQGVHDLVKRCDRILAGYEEKLHLVERFRAEKERTLEIRRLTDNYQNNVEAAMKENRKISQEILEEL